MWKHNFKVDLMHKNKVEALALWKNKILIFNNFGIDNWDYVHEKLENWLILLKCCKAPKPTNFFAVFVCCVFHWNNDIVFPVPCYRTMPGTQQVLDKWTLNEWMSVFTRLIEAMSFNKLRMRLRTRTGKEESWGSAPVGGWE